MTGRFTREPSSGTRIRFQDCDPFGHLNNARYLDYFINARENHLAECYGLDIYERQKSRGTNWVVAKTRIAYLRPAMFRENVTIQTRLLAFTRSGLLMEGVMTGEGCQDLKAVLWMDFRHFDLVNLCPATHSQDLMSLFEKIHLPGCHLPGFDARVRQISEKTAEICPNPA